MTSYRYAHVFQTEPDFEFWSDGIPAPQGSKSHIGDGKLVESSKKVAPWRAAIKKSLVTQKPAGFVPMDGPLACRVTFWLPRPGSHPKTKYTLPVGPPDVDKLGRGALDPLTLNGIIHDDSRIIDLYTCKRFVPTDPRHALADDIDRPGALFELWFLKDVDPKVLTLI